MTATLRKPWAAELEERRWLTGSFSIADIGIAEVLRIIDRMDGLAGYTACRGCVARSSARPALIKAYVDTDGALRGRGSIALVDAQGREVSR